MEDGPKAGGDAPHVVIVDPSPARRRRISTAVTNAGGVPIEAATPLEAVVRVGASRVPPAAAVVAEQATQTDSAELIGYLRDTLAGAPVARLTDEASDDADAEVDGAAPVLPIEDAGSELTARVRSLIPET
ncbi:MAG: hypothetical protein H6709_16210 [Kofleriaceae bacterium]|nr:hypothetical protein [Kofleriaceae bacterium]MCB9573624.1 hypothetical protein [Kofleriaceae bacterium]